MKRVASILLLAVGALLAGATWAANATGESIYHPSGPPCAGADGAGVLPGVPDLSGKDGPLAAADEVLLKRIAEGFQSPGSPLAMPPRGGNPKLSNEDLAAVLNYMRKEFMLR